MSCPQCALRQKNITTHQIRINTLQTKVTALEGLTFASGQQAGATKVITADQKAITALSGQVTQLQTQINQCAKCHPVVLTSGQSATLATFHLSTADQVAVMQALVGLTSDVIAARFVNVAQLPPTSPVELVVYFLRNNS